MALCFLGSAARSWFSRARVCLAFALLVSMALSSLGCDARARVTGRFPMREDAEVVRIGGGGASTEAIVIATDATLLERWNAVWRAVKVPFLVRVMKSFIITSQLAARSSIA